jgi:hypothetical protein
MMLQELAEKHGTDKAHFGYAAIYEKYLADRREEVRVVLEIGIKEGASLRMWKEYFPKALIWGWDIDPKTMIYGEDRIITSVFDQGASSIVYRNVLGRSDPSPIDIVIDDGSHWQHHILNSYYQLWKYLAPGGLYFIEDVASLKSLEAGDTWGSKEPDFSDSVIKIFEKSAAAGEDVDIYYAQQPPLTEAATSDFIVIKKPLVTEVKV